MQERLQLQILKILKASPSGTQTEELAEKLGLTRHTIAKYLEVLRAEGKIYYQKIGRTKLWKELSATASIRLLAMSDLDAILQIEEKTGRERGAGGPERLEWLKETAVYHLRQGDPLMNLGAEIDGRLAGFVFGEIKLWEFGRGEKTGWIKVVEVDPEYRGKGVGHKLGETLVEHFLRKDVKRVWTLVDWYEGELISYFKSLGFKMLSMIPLEKELE